MEHFKGMLYRKIKGIKETKIEVQKIDDSLPGFNIKLTSQRFSEFPEFEKIEDVKIDYPLIEPFAYANIAWDPESKELIYSVIEPQITQEEKDILKKISEGLIELVDVELSAIRETEKAIDYLKRNVKKVVKEYGIALQGDQYIKIMYYIYRNFLGLNEIEPLMQDPNIEDISEDGVNNPIYIIHRKFGSLRTNIVITTMEYLRDLVVKLAERTGRYVSYAEPILAGTLPDGSRVSATLAGDVATKGPTFTIRKFRENPFSPTEQITSGTTDASILAYFWYLIEHGSSILIVGGTATGKTSFLNTLAMFIPVEAKIVSIEDTRELKIPHQHWAPGLSRVGFGIPMPTGEKYGEVTMFDLLKESFRQNPDYVIVGEVRGAETYVMFQGMASGHPSLSTFHAGSVDTLIKRLVTPPIDLSPTLIESLDVIVIMVHAREKGKTARRTKEIHEVESVDARTGEVKTRKIFEWDPVTDSYRKTSESLKIQKLVASVGTSLEEAEKEIKRRENILNWFKEKEIKDFLELTNLINTYYKEPEKIAEMMGTKFEVPVKISRPTVLERRPEMKIPVAMQIPARQNVAVQKPLEKGERVSLLDLLGFKIIRER